MRVAETSSQQNEYKASAPALHRPGSSASVAAQATIAMAAARGGVRQWLAAIPHASTKPKQLQVATDLDYTLCWQLISLAHSEGLARVAEVPGPISLKRLLAASARLGLPEVAAAALHDGLTQFYSIAAAQAGSRGEFDSMVQAIAGGCQIDTQLRRTAFRTDSQIWGIQVELFHQIGIFARRPTPSTVSHVLYTSKHGLRTLRPGVARVVSGMRSGQTGADAPLTAGAPRVNFPLDPATFNSTGAPVLQGFSTRPLPRFRSTDTEDGWRITEVDDDGLGLQSAVDLAFATISDASEFEEGVASENAICSGVICGTPTREMIIDMAVPPGLFGPIVPAAIVHANRPGYVVLRAAAAGQQLHVGGRLSLLGTGADALFHPKLSRAPELFRHLCGEAGWSPDEFEIHRLTIDYPVLHSVVKLYADVT
jgi:hypothetical protein